jgi:hypothetical protein
VFERRDYIESTGDFVLSPEWNDQSGKRDKWQPNTDQLKANYNIYFQYDPNDQNTMDNQDNITFQLQLSLNTVTNEDLVEIYGLEQVAIPFARGVRKNELTIYEKIAKVLAKTVDLLTSSLGNGTNLSGKVKGRVGAMHLSNHEIAVPKLVHVAGTKLSFGQENFVSAPNLFHELHFINSFAPINGRHNQYKIYKGKPQLIKLIDFLPLLENLNVKDDNNNRAIIDEMKWRSYTNEATIDYSSNELYDNNFKLKYLQ